MIKLLLKFMMNKKMWIISLIALITFILISLVISGVFDGNSDEQLFKQLYFNNYLDLFLNSVPFVFLIYSCILLFDIDHPFYLALMGEFGKTKVMISRCISVFIINTLFIVSCLFLNFVIECLFTQYFFVGSDYILMILNLLFDNIIIHLILFMLIRQKSRHLIFVFLALFFLSRIFIQDANKVLQYLIYFIFPLSKDYQSSFFFYKISYVSLLLIGNYFYLRNKEY
jgi:hypothetical protein